MNELDFVDKKHIDGFTIIKLSVRAIWDIYDNG
jgi:hypothetical protein